MAKSSSQFVISDKFEINSTIETTEEVIYKTESDFDSTDNFLINDSWENVINAINQ